MKALINKDIKAYTLLMLGMFVIIILYSYLCIRFGSIKGILGLTVVMLPSIVGIIVFIGDYQLHHLILSMSVSRKIFVISKYISTLLFSIILIGISVLIMYLLSFEYTDAKLEIDQLLSLRGLIFCMTPITLIISVCYPLLFKYGLKIGVRIVMGTFALLYGIGMVVAQKWIQSNFLVPGGGIFNAFIGVFNHYDHLGTVFYLIIILMLAGILLLSVMFSIHTLKQKDIA
ncbi:MAG: ABC-2 transporter permease [Clostridiales bacterium]|nr:ABC-2 transporter permease [Clostridiales bacterium]